MNGAAYTTQDLIDIKAAIASGALAVQYSDKKITYRSTQEMLMVRDMIEKELGLQSSGRLSITMRPDKGLRTRFGRRFDTND